MAEVIQGVSAEEIVAALRESGCRAGLVDAAGALRIESAAQGLPFTVIPARPAGDDSPRYTDIVFRCVVSHAFPAGVDAWNASRRFARMAQHGSTVMLTLDVLAAGGVTTTWLRAQCELWQLLLGEFVQHLLAGGREQPAPVASAVAG